LGASPPAYCAASDATWPSSWFPSTLRLRACTRLTSLASESRAIQLVEHLRCQLIASGGDRRQLDFEASAGAIVRADPQFQRASRNRQAVLPQRSDRRVDLLENHRQLAIAGRPGLDGERQRCW
jgi:hypothetical protein